MFEETVQLRLEGRIGLGVLVGLFQLKDERHQRLGDETATINAKQAVFIRAGAKGIGGHVLVHEFLSSLRSLRPQ